MSEIKVNKISPRSGTAFTLGDSGDTFTVPSGGTLTIACGATITNNGTQTGFGRTGAVNWDTTVKTGDFTAANGEGYFVNTAGGAVTVTLPASPSAGAIVGISDYNGSSKTNDITIGRNGSNINGAALDLKLTKSNSAVQLVYVDATTGWQNITTANPLDLSNPFIEATGGCESTCGDYKIHTFNGPGTFTVSKISCVAAENTVSYLVVGGGGGGGRATSNGAGGGGGGGFREYKGPADCYTASPLNGNPGGTAVTVTATSFPITVGAGSSGAGQPASRGSPSIFSTITSTGGGGGHNCTAGPLQPGGSGGGVAYATPSAGGSGNTPPVSPPQGQPAGTAATHPTNFTGSGGGGATGAGGNGGPGPAVGGVGATTNISGSPTAFSGGGGGGVAGPTGGSGGAASPCGTGGAGKAKSAGAGDNGTTNRGGGGGGSGFPGPACGGNGGSGIVIIRYKFQ